MAVRLTDTMRMKLLGISMVCALVAGCGEPSPPADAQASPRPQTPTASAQLYEGTGTVLESREHGPQLCLGGVMESLPPQCGGITLVDWEWSSVDGEETAAGTTWGTFHVTGTYDGESMEVAKVGPPEYARDDGDEISTPCAEPAGGWVQVNPATAGHEHASRAAQLARRAPDFAGVWFDYYGEADPSADSDEEAYGDIILNVAFTGDLDRHERELREVWGGPLCLTAREHTYDEVADLRSEVEGALADYELEMLWSSTDETRGTIEIGVVAIDEETRREIDERFGAGTVKIDAALTPVE